MTVSKKQTLLIGFLLLTRVIYSQQISSFSTSSMFLNHTALFTNSAVIPDKSELQLGNISVPGAFGNLRQFYFSGITNFGIVGSHNAGITVLRYQRGELLSETSIKGLYCYQINLNDDLYLSLGTHFGIYQLGLKGTSKTASASDVKFNSDWSLRLEAYRWQVAGTIANITSPDLVLITQGIEYPLTGYFYGEYMVVEKNHWRSRILSQWSMSPIETVYVFGIQQDFRDRFSLGVNAGNRSYSVTGGISKIPLSGMYLHVMLGYQRQFAKGVASSFTPIQIQLKLNKK